MSAGELSFGAPQSGVLSFGIVSRRPLVLLDDGRMSEMPFGETLQPATMPPDTTSWANLPGMPAVIAAGADAAAARAAIGAAAASGGDVVGPASATDGMVAAFDGATGKLLKAVTLTNTDVGAAPINTTLTDAAATNTLPATTAEPIASHLQVLRNNVKQAFADLANKQATLVSGTNIKTVGGQSLLGTGNVPTGEPLPTATTITRTGGVITSMTEIVGGTSRVTTITRSGGVVTQIEVAHNGATRTETLTRTDGRVTGITVTET